MRNWDITVLFQSCLKCTGCPTGHDKALQHGSAAERHMRSQGGTKREEEGREEGRGRMEGKERKGKEERRKRKEKEGGIRTEGYVDSALNISPS